MPRKPVWPPRVYRHHTGHAFCRWKGREYWLGRHGTPEAQQAYCRLLAELEAGRTPEPRRTASVRSVADVVAAWEEREGPRHAGRARGLYHYRRALAPLLALYGDTPAADLDADRLEALQLATARGSWCDPPAAAWSRRTVNQRLAKIRTVWRWAERKKLVPAGSWGNLRTLPGMAANDPRVRHLPKRKPAEWPDVLRLARSLRRKPRLRALLLLLWWSGMRPGEARVLRPCDLDRRDPGVWYYRPSVHKNDWRGRERIVALGPRCRAVLGPWLRGAGPEDYLLRPREKVPGKVWGRDALTAAVRKAARRAGVRVTAYQCRHSAKDRITRAHGLEAARAYLGQRSLDTTNGYGTALDVDAAARAARKSG